MYSSRVYRSCRGTQRNQKLTFVRVIVDQNHLKKYESVGYVYQTLRDSDVKINKLPKESTCLSSFSFEISLLQEATVIGGYRLHTMQYYLYKLHQMAIK